MTIRSRIAVLVAIALLGVACSNVRKRNLDAGNDTGSASGAVDSSGTAPGAEDTAAVSGGQDGQASGREVPASTDGGPANTQDLPPADDNDAAATGGGSSDADDDAVSSDDSGGAEDGSSLCASGCRIAGTCHANGASNPDNVCLICDVKRSTTGWSASDGITCDDGLFCTVADRCAAGECKGFIRDCSDGVACNGLEICDELSRQCVAGTSTCTGDTICESRTGRCVANCPGCAIGGTCYSDGQVNPANVCQKCTKTTSTSDWSNNDGATCDDDRFCTVGDKCSGGTCAGAARNCSDSIACNGDEICDENNDACLAGTTTCTPLQVCNAASGQCVAISTTICPGCLIDGTCFGEGQSNPANPCQRCTRTTDALAWSHNDGAMCDDGQFCTVGDTCAAGACAGTERACADGIACNGTETCDEAADACVAGTTTCTESQVCDVKTGGCVAISTCPGCVIDHTCYGDGQVNQTNPCQKCSVSANPADWSNNNGAACDDGLFCTVGDTCSTGTCAGTTRTCSDGVVCNGDETCDETNDVCAAGTPTCTGNQVCDVRTDQCIATCTGCLIAGTCYGVGQANPSNPCQRCSTDNRSAWSLNDGALCDDGQFCTVGDTCSGGACAGTTRSCLDGIACNGDETCDEDNNRCAAGTPTCTGGQVCDVGTGQCIATCPGCLIGGKCYGAGQTNPGNSCQKCPDNLSTTVWSDMPDNTACDDGLFCNGADSCVSGACNAHGVSPCGGGTTCFPSKRACYMVGVLLCNADGNVVHYNPSTGDEVLDQICGSTANRVACSNGACGCAPGYTGDDCHPQPLTCIVYVSKSGSASNGGTSWADSVAGVQMGIDLARDKSTASGGMVCEAWVAAGVYALGSDPANTFQLRANVALFGGFAGTETARAQRNVTANTAYLLGTGTNYHVVTGATGATIDGFTISGGNATGADSDASGGGMLNNNASPTVSNCTFSANAATNGGAMANLNNASPTVSNCTFTTNSATNGGAMFNQSGSPAVSNCTFTANSATIGGAMFNQGSPLPTVINSILWNDTATSAGAEVNDDSNPSVTYCLVQGGHTAGSNNVTSNPMFIGGSADMRLMPGSPAIDQGTGCGSVPSTDKDGKPRRDITSVGNPTGRSGVDIGAFEYQGGASDSTVTNLCPTP